MTNGVLHVYHKKIGRLHAAAKPRFWMTALGLADVGVFSQAMWMDESYKLNVLPSYLTPLVPSPASDPVCEALDAAWFFGSLGRARVPLLP